jgi:hypothetical protein
MTVELKMNAKNNAYTIISLLFFIPYILFQPVATVMLRKIGPRIFLSTLVFLWGVVMIVSRLVEIKNPNHSSKRCRRIMPRGFCCEA